MTGTVPNIHEIAKWLYRPLGAGETRVLALRAGNLGDNLVADLFPVRIEGSPENLRIRSRATEDKVKYVALSYAWGTMERSCVLLLNGFRFPITENLWAALQRLRSRTDDRHLWVDAVCINQCNYEERSQQVTMMTQIYHGASVVVAWLGDYQEHSRLALDYLKAGQRSFEGYCAACERNIHCGLRDLYTRPWLRRIWVRREVWAAQKVIVACGRHQLTWHGYIMGTGPTSVGVMADEYGSSLDTDNLRTLSILVSSDSTAPIFGASFGSNNTERFFQNEGPRELIALLRQNIRSESSDLRDRVYALLDMAEGTTDERTSGLVVDYSKKVDHVFTDVARHAMLRERSICVLYLSASFGGSLQSFSPQGPTNIDGALPSWVPDWCRKTSTWPWLNIAFSIVRHIKDFRGLCLPVLGLRDEQRFSHPGSLKLTLSGVGCAILCADSIAQSGQSAMRDELRAMMYDHIKRLCESRYGKAEYTDKQYIDFAINTNVVEAARCNTSAAFRFPDGSKASDLLSAHAILRTLVDQDGHVGSKMLAHALEDDRDIWCVPKSAKKGDLIVLVEGGTIPITIRPLLIPGEYVYIGPALCLQDFGDKSTLAGFLRTYKDCFCMSLHLLLGARKQAGGLKSFTLV